MPRRHSAYAVQIRSMGIGEIRTLHHDTDYAFVLGLYQRVSHSPHYQDGDVWLVGLRAAEGALQESVIFHRRPRQIVVALSVTRKEVRDAK